MTFSRGTDKRLSIQQRTEARGEWGATKEEMRKKAFMLFRWAVTADSQVMVVITDFSLT